MKSEIHPQYVDSIITCSCGNQIHTRSTKPAMHVDHLLAMPPVLHR